MTTRLKTAIDNAEADFWSAIAESYPEAKTGDFPPDASLDLYMALQKAVRQWLGWNAIPAIGTRVRFTGPVDRFPHDIVEAGEVGTIVEIDEHCIAVHLDTDHPALGEWGNCCHWYPGHDQDLVCFLDETEVIPETGREDAPYVERDGLDTDTVWHFQFGAYASTHILIEGGSLEDGLERAMDILAEKAPGEFVEGMCEPCEKRNRKSGALSGPGVDATWGCDECSDGFAHDTTIAGHTSYPDLPFSMPALLSYEWYVREATADIIARFCPSIPDDDDI